MSLEQLVYKNVVTKKNGQKVVDEKDEAMMTLFLTDFVSSLVQLSGYQLTEDEIVEKMKEIKYIRFSSFPKEKVDHEITLSSEIPIHTIYQLNLGLVDEILNNVSTFSWRKRNSLEEQVGSTCYQGLVHDMADRIFKAEYPKFVSSPKRATDLWPQSEVMGILVDVIGEEAFFTNIVRNPVSFSKVMNMINYQNQPLHNYLDTRLQQIEPASDIDAIISNDMLMDCVEAINEVQPQLAHQFVKYK